MQQFFLSRAAGDDDSYSLRFFRDLSARVAERVEVDGAPGFVDVETRPGVDAASPWSATAWAALTGCQVFVALCSPRYFLNDRCGREWWTFAERLRRYERATGRQAPALVPVLWEGAVPVDDSEARAVRHLVRLRSLRLRYESYLESLADRIVTSLRAHDIPRLSPETDPAAVPNAFDMPDGPDGSAPAPPAPGPKELVGTATRHVHFIVAAGSRSEMAKVRDDLQFYGERGEDWAPYRPSLPGSLAGYARRVAALRLFGSDVADLTDLARRIDRARRDNEIVVLLVDSWITKLSAYRQTLSSVDERPEPTVAVLAPANSTDPETTRHRGELSSELCNALRHYLTRGDQLLRMEIDDTETFEADLVAVLEEAQNRIFRHGHVFRRPAAEAPVGRPILQGP